MFTLTLTLRSGLFHRLQVSHITVIGRESAYTADDDFVMFLTTKRDGTPVLEGCTLYKYTGLVNDLHRYSYVDDIVKIS